jgi:gamma-glutamylcyclotransferase (GGCT)/AIG2-like uncharacterized protein YtfP
MKTKYYFAYGCNTNTNEMHARCPNAVLMGTARLEGYKFEFANHATIKRSNPDVTEGTIWKITEACEQSLDMLEGYPKYYSKLSVVIRQHNEYAPAMVYIMNPELYKAEKPTTGYFITLAEGYAENNIPLSQLTDAADEVDFNYNLYLGESFLHFVNDSEGLTA